MLRKVWHITAMALAGAILLAGCDVPVAPVKPTPVPVPRPGAVQPSEKSAELKAYYTRVQASLLTQGLLRTDGGGPDTPFTPRNIVDNFMRVALYQEYQEIGGQLVARQNASRLHRWEVPVNLSVTYGPSVPAAQRAKDDPRITRYVERLSNLTGLSINRTRAGGNFRVMILNEDERLAIGPEIRKIMPGISPAALNAVVNMSRNTYCLAFASDPQEDGSYDQAVVIIRGEHPDLLRASCIHEEIAQGLGLSNDSPRARPSIFNDDEEFGLLTTHDEVLLKILYDRRLRPGMTEAEARPIVEIIAAEMVGGSV